MKEIWTLTVKTSLPEVCRDKSDFVTTTSAYENFEDARNTMRSVLKEYAFSKNEMFNGKGYISELAFYSDEAERIEKNEGIEDEDESDWLSSKKLNYMQELLHRIFEGKDVEEDVKGIKAFDMYLKTEISGQQISMVGFEEGPWNGYDPLIKTNMLDMTEEKDYYIYLDDMFGQDEASSELYIDLKKTILE